MKFYKRIATVGILAGAVGLPLGVAGFIGAAQIALAVAGICFVACMLLVLWSL